MILPTPVLRSGFLSAHLNRDVYYKLEIWNPTGSHKDRESRAIIQECESLGIREIGCASSGNFGISLAYYSSIRGMTCHVWVSNDIHPEKLALLIAFKATIHKKTGDLAELYEKSSRWFSCMGIYDANPGVCAAKIEGNKELAREIIEQIKDVRTVLACVNNGTHLLGLAEVFANTEIRLIGVYTYSCYANSISGFHGVEGKDRMKEMVKCCNGDLTEADDNDLSAGLNVLFKESILCEPSSAAPVGVLVNNRNSLVSKDKGSICCVITGTGLKFPAEIASLNSLKAKEKARHSFPISG